jgi:hypothetical protein
VQTAAGRQALVWPRADVSAGDVRSALISLLWRVVLLLTAAHAVYNIGHDRGSADTENYYESQDEGEWGTCERIPA